VPADAAEEALLADALQRYGPPNGQAPRDLALRDEILASTDWLAARGARRFSDAGEPFDDLLQVARVGLFKALERFDPAHGVPFGAYATPTIMGELRRHFRDHTWSIHVPRRAKDLRPAVNAAMQELSAELNRSPRVDEVALRLHVTAEVVIDALDANQAYRTHSLDNARSAHLAKNDAAVDMVLDREVVAGLLDQLPPRERKVLYYRFYDELSQAQIAELIGTSQVHVGRILAASFARMRALLDGTSADTG
jgi:RNA polymerase sigma-B factor